MEATNTAYSHEASNDRIRDILDSAETFEEVNEIPPRSRLTYSNGFYVNCTAVFIDIRGSSRLPENHNRPVLGKLYRAYLSECVAVLNSNPSCREVFINGDCVSGVLNTPLKSDIDEAFFTAGTLNCVIDILNWRLRKKGYSAIECGIGIAYGRALMLKAGYSGSGINDVIWMGDVVNEASNLCHQGNKLGFSSMQVSASIQNNLKDEYRRFLTCTIDFRNYECHVVPVGMSNWLREQKESEQGVNELVRLFAPYGGHATRGPTAGLLTSASGLPSIFR